MFSNPLCLGRCSRLKPPLLPPPKLHIPFAVNIVLRCFREIVSIQCHDCAVNQRRAQRIRRATRNPKPASTAASTTQALTPAPTPARNCLCSCYAGDWELPLGRFLLSVRRWVAMFRGAPRCSRFGAGVLADGNFTILYAWFSTRFL